MYRIRKELVFFKPHMLVYLDFVQKKLIIGVSVSGSHLVLFSLYLSLQKKTPTDACYRYFGMNLWTKNWKYSENRNIQQKEKSIKE